MPKRGQKVVTMSGDNVDKLWKSYEKERKKRPTLSFASFVSDSAVMELERRNILKQAQLISFVAFTDSSVILKDAKKAGKLYEVQFVDKKPKCLTDDDFDCIHVGFALALPEVRTALAK